LWYAPRQAVLRATRSAEHHGYAFFAWSNHSG